MQAIADDLYESDMLAHTCWPLAWQQPVYLDLHLVAPDSRWKIPTTVEEPEVFLKFSICLFHFQNCHPINSYQGFKTVFVSFD